MLYLIIYIFAMVKLSVWLASELIGDSHAAVAFVGVVLYMLIEATFKLIRNIVLAGREAQLSEKLKAPVKIVYEKPNRRRPLILVEQDHGHYVLRPNFDNGLSIESEWDSDKWLQAKRAKSLQ